MDHRGLLSTAPEGLRNRSVDPRLGEASVYARLPSPTAQRLSPVYEAIWLAIAESMRLSAAPIENDPWKALADW
jgi:hypothetical protein